MVSSKAKTVAEYLEELPPERRKVVAAVRAVIRKNLPKGYREVMGWGMISYCVPLSRYPDTYNGQPLGYVALAAQKHHYSLYLMNIYSDSAEEESLRKAFKEAGKRADFGKCCVRFRKLEDLPLPVIGRVIRGTSVGAYIRRYETIKAKMKRGR